MDKITDYVDKITDYVDKITDLITVTWIRSQTGFVRVKTIRSQILSV